MRPLRWYNKVSKKEGLEMITKTARKGEQIEMVSLDQLVPEDHLLRKIDEHIDFSFI